MAAPVLGQLGMLAGMLGAIAVPGAFGDRALLVVSGYVAMQSVRTGLTGAAAAESIAETT